MSDNVKTDPPMILCDMCPEEDRKPARKTCMKCEISMCTQHLQVHLTTPVLLQTHPLTEPMALCGTTKCPQHGKLLEYYCLDDMTCVCVSCAIEDQHRLHNMKTFSTAHKELMEKLGAEQQALQVKTDDENVSLEKWEKSEREKLGGCSVRLIEAVTNLRDISLSSVQSSVSARMVSIKTSKSSMQAAQDEKDTFRFLQMYSQVHQDVEKAKAVDLRKGLEPGSHRDKLVEEIREGGEKMMEEASYFWGSLLTLVDPENHQEYCATNFLLTFDPQTLGPGMSLSPDKRKVFYNNWMGKRSRHMLSFQGTHTFPNFNKWVISLSEDCDWTIGFCDKSYAKEMKDGDVFGLRCKGRQLFSLTTEHEEEMNTSRPLKNSRNQTSEHPTKEKKRVVSLQEINLPDERLAKGITRPQKVEVSWKVGASLSFFSRIGQHQRVKILTLTLASVNWDLAPFVCFEEDESQNNSDVSRASAGFYAIQPNQKQWSCSCGAVYSETSDGYHYGGSIYQKSSHPKCYCGRLIGSPPTTKLLCELV